MTITYPLSLPNVLNIGGHRIVASKIELLMNVVVPESLDPYASIRQNVAYPGSYWSAKIDLPRMKRSEAEPWLAFLLSLWGKSGTFLLGDPLNSSLLGSAAGSPVVSGSNQTVTVPGLLNIRSLTGVLMPGDYFQIGSGVTSRLYKNLTQQGPGSVTLSIFPTLRDNPADGTALVLANPVGTFELSEGSVTWSVSNRLYNISFNATEAI